MPEPLPDTFKANITGAWPQDGPRFLARLPDLIREYETRWDIRALPPFALSYNYVAPALRADGTEVVLKLGVPNPEFTTEIEALRLYDGDGAARLIDADPARGAMLIERVRPGIPLAQVEDDDAATSIAADVMARLWRPLPPDHPFPDLRRWTRSLRQYAERYGLAEGPIPSQHIGRATALLDDLLVAPPEQVLIHADFHHDNVLTAEREPPERVPWLAIDPKGVAAEKAFDIGPLLYNPMPTLFVRPDLRRLTARRIDLLTELLALDRPRALACAYVAAVLSACWSAEGIDKLRPEFLGYVDVLAEMKP